VGKSSPKDGEYLDGVFVPNGKIVPSGISNVNM
jgi:hypothetical protein